MQQYTLKQSSTMQNKNNYSWSVKHKISVPCEQFKNLLLEKGVKFIEEYKPLKNRQFCIDVAFPDRKLGIEINGNQHYIYPSNKLAPYYQIRHDLIVDSGWTLLELHFSVVYDKVKIEEVIEKLLQQNNDLIEIDFSEYKPKQRSYPIVGEKIKHKANKQKTLIKNKELVDKLKVSSIDFTIFGWVQKASVLLQCTPQNINRLIKSIDSDFLKQCYARKAPR